jgi:peptidoglycan glycosyltransferase
VKSQRRLTARLEIDLNQHVVALRPGRVDIEDRHPINGLRARAEVVRKRRHTRKHETRTARECDDKTGTWEWHSGDESKNGDVWTVGFTTKIATAVWLGTKDGNYLNPKHDGPASNVFGNNFAGPIWHQFMTAVTSQLFGNTPADQRKFDAPGNTGNVMPDGAVASPTPTPPPVPTDQPTGPFPPATTPPPSPSGSPSSGGGQGSPRRSPPPTQ